MKHGSLFSGIGGFDLAAEWMGWENVFHCEWNEFGQRVLKHHFPKALSYADITETDFNVHRGRISVLSGGFPCQPYSSAGKRLGKEDERHLWPEMLRAIREIQPRWVVGENVLGLVNWNGGLVFEEVQADLEAEGYEVQPFILPACSVNAPHVRQRVWFCAYSTNSDNGSGSKDTIPARGKESDELYGLSRNAPDSEFNDRQKSPRNVGQESRAEGKGGNKLADGANNYGEKGNAPDSDNSRANESMRTNGERQTKNEGRQGFAQPELGQSGGNAPDSVRSRRGKDNGQGKPRQLNEKSKGTNWQNFPTKPPICGGDDGLPRELDSITFPKWRNESIKAYGNAIVPQVAHQIFKAIQEYEESLLH